MPESFTQSAGRFDDPKPDFIDIKVGGSLFSSKEIAAVEPRRPASFVGETKNRDILPFSIIPSAPKKVIGQAGFGSAGPPREGDVFAWLHSSW